MRHGAAEFPLQTVIILVIILVAFAVFLLLISQWGSSSQSLVGGVFDFFGTLLKTNPASSPTPAPATPSRGSGIPGFELPIAI